MKGRIVIFAGIALTVGVIVFHLHQAGFFFAKSVFTTPSQTAAIAEKIKIHPQPAIVGNQNSESIVPQADTAQVSTNSDTNLTAQLDAHFALMAWLRGLAATNLTAALEYLSKMPDGDERDDAVQAVCYGVAQKDPSRALAVAQELQVPSSVSQNIVQQWAASDMKSALAWVANQPAGDDRDEMIHRVVLALAPSDPADAAGLVLEQIPAGSAQDEAVMTVLNQWAYKDMKGAIAWVETFPDSPFKNRMVTELEGVEQYQKDLARQ